MMPLQDVLGLGDDARMNVPGVATGNWTWQAQEADVAAARRKLRSSCATPIDSGAKRDKTPDIVQLQLFEFLRAERSARFVLKRKYYGALRLQVHELRQRV